MSQGPANIESTQILKDFRAKFVVFDQVCRNALMGVDSEVKKTNDWLRGEQAIRAKMELRRAEEMVTRAQAELTQAKMRDTYATPSSCQDEIKAVRRAKEKKEQAETKVDDIKRWTNLLDQKVVKLMPPVSTLAILLDQKTPLALARLDQMIDALEAYFRTTSGGAP